jgi:predicted O-linked N-acetylglucosamine transferase (SPINDLY family)
VGLSLLKNVGLVEECVAGSLEDYVAKAVRLAGDRAKLAQLRKDLRPRMEASPLMDSKGFARRMEEAITGPILGLSEGLPPQGENRIQYASGVSRPAVK